MEDDKPSNSLPGSAQPKKSSVAVRVSSSIGLLAIMVLCYQMGHMYYSLLLIMFGFQTWREMMNISRDDKLDEKNPLNKILEWYFPLLLTYILTPHLFMRRVLFQHSSGLRDFELGHTILYAVFFTHHILISSCLLLLGMMGFTLNLKKGQYRY